MKELMSHRITRPLPGKRLAPRSPLLQQLKESQERLRAALECGNIGVFDWNTQTNRVIYIAPRMAMRDQALGAQEVDASHWLATTHPDDIARARGEVERAVCGETDGFSMRYRVKGPADGGPAWLVVHSRGKVRERDASGRAIRILGIFEEITHVAAREEADRVRDAQLARATQVAALGELALSLAHEINQPLATLTAYLQASTRSVRQKSITKAELAAVLQRSERQAQRVADIVRRLRMLYRDRQVTEESFDLLVTLQDVLHLLRHEIDTLNIQVKASCRFKKLVITGDRIQIEQVLYNIMRNAVDALQHYGRGHATLTYSIQRTGGRILIRIANNGPGIPANILNRMFEPFFTTKPKGTGLGLSISRSIIEAHRGSLTLDTTLKQGAAFVIDLPARRKVRTP